MRVLGYNPIVNGFIISRKRMSTLCQQRVTDHDTRLVTLLPRALPGITRPKLPSIQTSTTE